jgi:hypothetical protein
MFTGEPVSEYKTLLEFERPEYVKDLSASRTQEQGLLKIWMQISKQNSLETIELCGFANLAESVSSLLEAERVVISKEINSGKEFGTIRVECWVNECYSEYICDKAE